MTSPVHSGDRLDSKLAQLRGKLDDLERRVEALSELAARLPACLDASEMEDVQNILFYDGESCPGELF